MDPLTRLRLQERLIAGGGILLALGAFLLLVHILIFLSFAAVGVLIVGAVVLAAGLILRNSQQ